MKKLRGIGLILSLPFAISALAFISSTVAIQLVEKDITGIEWNYRPYEGFLIDGGSVSLTATAVSNKNYPLSAGNELVWSIQTLSGENVCEFKDKGDGKALLVPENEGRVRITCSNAKGTVSRSFIGIVGDAMIVINPKSQVADNSIAGKLNYGLWDYASDGTKTKSEAEFDVQIISDYDSDLNSATFECSDNIELQRTSDGIKAIFRQPGDSYITVSTGNVGGAHGISETTTFKVVDGVNVYDYDDLMRATNKAENAGESVVLRTDFKPLEDLYETDEDGDPVIKNGSLVRLDGAKGTLFGDYDVKTGEWSFDDDVYRFEMTLESPYIEQWNEIAAKDSRYTAYNTNLAAGIHLTGDLYGNGFTIDMHDLCYPYGEADRGEVIVPSLTEDNIFRGPKTYMALGDPSLTKGEVIALYGQDNCGVYVDADNVTIDDVTLSNCDFGNNLYNLTYVGNVIDIEASNVTIRNSIIQNGKNVVRAFSAPNLTIENCLLQNGLQYLLDVGSNNISRRSSYDWIDYDLPAEIADDAKANGKQTSYSGALSDFFAEGQMGDDITLSDMRTGFNYSLPIIGNVPAPYGDVSIQDLTQANSDIMDLISDTSRFIDKQGNKIFDTTVTVDNTLFSTSGVTPIGLENMFNGPYLFASAPSFINMVFNLLSGTGSASISTPVDIKDLGGTMAPSKVTITGQTKFYDWKSPSSMTLRNLVYLNLDSLANIPSFDIGDLNTDTLYPLIKELAELCQSQGIGFEASDDEEMLISSPIAKIGGGKNLSEVVIDPDSYASVGLHEITLDTDASLLALGPQDYPQNSSTGVATLMTRAILTATGFEDYSFWCYGSDSNIKPGDNYQIEELIKRAQELN